MLHLRKETIVTVVLLMILIGKAPPGIDFSTLQEHKCQEMWTVNIVEHMHQAG